MTFDERYNKLRDKAERVRTLGEIFDNVKREMEWNNMEMHQPDEDHEDRWFTEPDEDDYRYPRYKVYLEVLEAIENLAK